MTEEKVSAEISNEGRILIVDDTAANVRLLAAILMVEGFEVETAESGAQALQLLEESAPDVVLLDVMMPGMDGFEVCRRIRNDERPGVANLPVVMVTALQETRDRVQAIEAGADDFLTKPVEETEVVARVRSLVKAKRGRDALETAYANLREAEAMRDGLTSMLVHDLRTPLTTMTASLDLLQSESDSLNSLQRELTSMCARSTQQLLGLVNEILDIAKMESGQMTLQRAPLDYNALLEDVATQAVTRDSQNRVSFDIAPDVLPLHADADLLRRVLTNLVANALKFTDVDAGVEISVRNGEGDEKIGGEHTVVLAVCDHGEGIAPDDLERIFDKFAQAHDGSRSRDYSTGLGLTFCRLATQAHGGRIWAQSTLGQGSTFLVALPAQ